MAEKYINREKAIDEMKENSLKMFNSYYSYYKGYVRAIKDLIDMPTIDDVPVIRCKDCKFRKSSVREFSSKDLIEHYCEIVKRKVRYDDFCSYGERRNDDG